MVMGVSGVNREPVLGGVWPALGVRARALPVLICHPLEELRRRFARPTHGFERWLDGSVGGQLVGVSLLVISVDDRLVLGQQAADPDRGRHLAVREVMSDLARRPLAAGGAIQLLGLDSLQRVHHHAVAVAVSLDQPCSLLSFHRVASPNQPNESATRSLTKPQARGPWRGSGRRSRFRARSMSAARPRAAGARRKISAAL